MNGKSAKTADTVSRILAAADNVFLKNGHGDFSLRKIADAAEISVGNLTYHFPNREALLQAVLSERQAMFVAGCLDGVEETGGDPTNLLWTILGFYMQDAWDSRPVYYQIWGYAASSDEARDFVANIYAPLADFIFALVRTANPRLEPERARRVVFQLASLAEGARAMIGIEAEDGPSMYYCEVGFRDLIKQIVFAED
ncbi:MAG: TetR/AcrR family transcriptional regulator [Pseudomonadota bacterium]